MNNPNVKLNELRMQIDLIDKNLLSLLEERVYLVTELFDIKNQNQIPLRDYKREKEIIERLINAKNNILDEEAVNIVFECVLYQSRRLAMRTFDIS